MKFLLILRVSHAALDRLSDKERRAVQRGHDDFQRVAREAGELISTQSLADPSTSTIIRDGVPATPAQPAGEFVGGYYLIDVESKHRAVELAALLPDAHLVGLAVEIRPIMLTTCADY